MTYYKNFLFLSSIGSLLGTNLFRMKNQRSRLMIIAVIIITTGTSIAHAQISGNSDMRAEERLRSWKNPLTEFRHIGRPGIDSVTVVPGEKILSIYFAATLSYYPFREAHIETFKASLSESLGRRYRKHEIRVFTNRYMLEDLIPNIYRTSIPVDSSRIIRKDGYRPVMVRKTDGYAIGSVLAGKGIALWHSHGYFYEASLDRWEWQRAKLFGTVEDLSTMAYVLPYLTAMLENAGASVFLPRERDFQVYEAIVDNDRSTGESEVVLHLGTGMEDAGPGFLFSDTIFAGENPFRKGTSIRIKEDTASFIPDIPATGDYAVYVTWPLRADNSREVKYSVHHTGGTTDFIADQTIGGPTWIYLGTFHFRNGKNRAGGRFLFPMLPEPGPGLALMP
jgi:hypothetical protein